MGFVGPPSWLLSINQNLLQNLLNLEGTGSHPRDSGQVGLARSRHHYFLNAWQAVLISC